MKWKPIETAPKDQPILLYPWGGCSSGVTTAFWMDDSEWDEWAGRNRPNLYWAFNDYQ